MAEAALSVGALTALGLASLPEQARIARLAALVRRGHVTPDRVRAVCEEFLEPATAHPAVLDEAQRQARSRQSKPWPWTFQPLSLKDRRAALLREVLGKAHYHDPPYADFIDTAVMRGGVFALVRSFGRRRTRVTLIAKLRCQKLVRVRVPATLRSVEQALQWLVADDLPDTPEGDALWMWVLERSRQESRRG